MYRKNAGMYIGKTRFLCAVGCASAKSHANPPPKPGSVCSFVVLLPARSLEKTSLSIPGGKNDREEFVECPAYRESGWLVAGLLSARGAGWLYVAAAGNAIGSASGSSAELQYDGVLG